jgi:hypothetical protein
MGWIICHTHGGGFIVLTCSHVRDAVRSGGDVPVGSFHDELTASTFPLCVPCLQVWNAAPPVQISDAAPPEILVELYDTLIPVCAKCFRASTMGHSKVPVPPTS